MTTINKQMREIKFRVWDKKNNVMTLVDTIGWMYKGGINTVYVNNDPVDTRENPYCLTGDDFELMQYTGLKDKNGKEIYESDLLKLDSWADIQQVVFVEGAFRLASVGKADENFTSDLHYVQHAGIPQAKVIGNIFESKDLVSSLTKE